MFYVTTKQAHALSKESKSRIGQARAVLSELQDLLAQSRLKVRRSIKQIERSELLERDLAECMPCYGKNVPRDPLSSAPRESE